MRWYTVIDKDKNGNPFNERNQYIHFCPILVKHVDYTLV